MKLLWLSYWLIVAIIVNYRAHLHPIHPSAREQWAFVDNELVGGSQRRFATVSRPPRQECHWTDGGFLDGSGGDLIGCA